MYNWRFLETIVMLDLPVHETASERAMLHVSVRNYRSVRFQGMSMHIITAR